MALKECRVGHDPEFWTTSRSNGRSYCKKCANDRRSRTKRRLPVAPLLEYAERNDIPFAPEDASDGKVGFFQADRYAVKCLGTHPALIYGDLWWQAAAA